MKKIILTLLTPLAGAAQAHEGHGLPGVAHWHATDVGGVLLLALVIGAVAWWRGRK